MNPLAQHVLDNGLAIFVAAAMMFLASYLIERQPWRALFAAVAVLYVILGAWLVLTVVQSWHTVPVH